MLHFNLNWLDELKDEKLVNAAHSLLRLTSVPVFKALAIVWLTVLVMVFTFIVTVRIAAYLPLPL